MSSDGLKPAPLRLGFAVKVMGEPGLRSHDTRRWQSGPHLRVSIEALHAVFDYLDRHAVRMYRMSSDLAPYVTHPGMPAFHHQIAECDADLAALGRRARGLGLRLSFHPSQFILLNAPDPSIVARSVADLAAQAEMLDRMGLGPEAVVVTHVGGTYGDRAAGRTRWAEAHATLPEPVRRRLVLENDDLSYSAADVLEVHERTGVPLVFDHQHHWCFNPEGLGLADAARRFARTWPAGVRPKLHFSSPRTELREVKRKGKTGKAETRLLPPVWTGHADFVQPFEFVTFLRLIPDVEADVMLEAKCKDLALRKLRRDLAAYAPDVAARFGVAPAEAAGEEDEVTVAAATGGADE